MPRGDAARDTASRGSAAGTRPRTSIKTQNPRGETVYWVGAAGAAADAGEGTDFHAVEQRFVSVTPLQIDLTNRDADARAVARVARAVT